jgi:energy-coupling factor transporter ATP-binding protein EcfA2
MSGGEKARLALACVWVMGPRTLLLDETESLLDRRGVERLHAALDALPRETSVLHVTTDPNAASGHARALVLHAGRLVADAPPDDVFATLPDEVLQRIDTPLAWRVSRELVRAGRLAQPTASWPRLLQQLDAGHTPNPERA